ncbi:MAG: hypothetical protein HY260_03205 [Chloroflexi bacterium]|nr:hypothetical protein [Chloroflexota bacterium]
MLQPFERRTISLVVRLWVEPVTKESSEPRWRGQMENVGTGAKAYFQDTAGMLEAVGKLAPGFVTGEHVEIVEHSRESGEAGGDTLTPV